MMESIKFHCLLQEAIIPISQLRIGWSLQNGFANPTIRTYNVIQHWYIHRSSLLIFISNLQRFVMNFKLLHFIYHFPGVDLPTSQDEATCEKILDLFISFTEHMVRSIL